MDEERFEELKRKRRDEGLTEDEANELGRMFAEREGKPYAHAEEPTEDDKPEAWKDPSERQGEGGEEG